jgi:hypothetical protein
MVKVSIIGSGNVAQHLISAFSTASGIELIQAFSRNRENLAHLLDPNQITDDLNALPMPISTSLPLPTMRSLKFRSNCRLKGNSSRILRVASRSTWMTGTAKPFFIRCRRSQKQTVNLGKSRFASKAKMPRISRRSKPSHIHIG